MGTPSNAPRIGTSKPSSAAPLAASAPGTAALFPSFLFKVLGSLEAMMAGEQSGERWRLASAPAGKQMR